MTPRSLATLGAVSTLMQALLLSMFHRISSITTYAAIRDMHVGHAFSSRWFHAVTQAKENHQLHTECGQGLSCPFDVSSTCASI
jgi:hypothetical protein